MTQQTEENQAYIVYYLPICYSSNTESENNYWEISSNVYLNKDKAQTFADTLKCKTKIETVYIVE